MLQIGTMNWMAPEILEATSPQYPYMCASVLSQHVTKLPNILMVA